MSLEENIRSESWLQSWMVGMGRALPIMIGYLPIGFAYGVLARQAGLSGIHIVMMSLIVFAGSAQFIAVSMLSGGMPAISIILTTFIVNLRHLLFSAAISPHLKSFSKLEISLFTYQLTDESFALHSSVFQDGVPPKPAIFGLNVAAYVTWACGSALGAFIGQIVGDTSIFGLDYALLAMFAALLVMQMQNRLHVVIALFTGLLSTGLKMIGLDQWYVITAALIGASVGTVMDKWMRRESS